MQARLNVVPVSSSEYIRTGGPVASIAIASRVAFLTGVLCEDLTAQHEIFGEICAMNIFLYIKRDKDSIKVPA